MKNLQKKKRVQTENLKRIKSSKNLKIDIKNFKMRGLKMPSGKVKWFNAKKVMNSLKMMSLKKIFFFMFQHLKNLN